MDDIHISIAFNQENGLRVTVFVLPQMKIDSIDPCVRTTRHVALSESSPGRGRLRRLSIAGIRSCWGWLCDLWTRGRGPPIQKHLLTYFLDERSSCKEDTKPRNRTMFVSNEINFLSAICPRQSKKRARKVTWWSTESNLLLLGRHCQKGTPNGGVGLSSTQTFSNS